MLRNLSKATLFVSVFFCLLVRTTYPDVSKTHLTIALLPCSDVVMTFKKFHPLMTYLKQETGLMLETVVPNNYEEFEWALKNGDIDFAFQDPHTYVSLVQLYNIDALIRAETRDGRTYQYGLIIAMKDSGITRIRDLNGKTVMFGPKLSATKWIAAKEVFKQNGILIDKDLRSYLNGGCCEDIAFNVYMKAVDAGLVCDHFLEAHPERQKELGIDIKQIRIIGRTGSVPTKVFAARKTLDNSVVTKINRALLSLDRNNSAHAKILYPAELGGFQKSTDADYDEMRVLIGEKP